MQKQTLELNFCHLFFDAIGVIIGKLNQNALYILVNSSLNKIVSSLTQFSLKYSAHEIPFSPIVSKTL